jgi:hypothetical protein
LKLVQFQNKTGLDAKANIQGREILGVSPSTTSSMGMQVAFLSTMDVQGVFLSTTAVWTCRVCPLAPPAVLTCRVYPFQCQLQYLQN